MTYQHISMFLAGVNVTLLMLMLFQYARMNKNKIPGLVYCIAQFIVSIIYSVVITLCFIIPQGPMLEFLVRVALCCSVWVNTCFILIIFALTSKENSFFIRFKWLLLIVPLVFTLLFLTDNFHHLVLESVTKQPGEFNYHVVIRPLAIPAFVYSFALSAIAVLKVFRSGIEGIIPNARVRWFLVFITVMPFLFTVAEELVPLLKQLHISAMLTWLPVTIIAYLFFGYLSTARRMAIDEMDDAYVVFDLRGYCVDMNPKGAAFFKQHAAVEWPRASQLERLLPQGNNHLPHFTECEIELDGQGGKLKYYRISSFRLSSGLNQYCGNGYIIREVTDYRRKIGQLNSMASEDPLTGAKNRRHLEISAEEAVERARTKQIPLSFLMLDIDFFKRINDTYGHLAGDEVLAEIFTIFSHNVREQDIVFRYGGEEFLVLCEGTALADATQLAQRIRKAVESHVFSTSAGDLTLTISIGVYASIPAEGETMEDLVGKADEYLYKAKQNGRNRVEVP